VNPYLAFESIDDLLRQGLLTGVERGKAVTHYIKALNKGILKVMSKMGISTLASYCGAQIFEAVGLSKALVDRYFTYTPTRVEGIGIVEVSEEIRRRHEKAFPRRQSAQPDLDWGGEYLAPGWRVPPVQPGHRVQAPARDALGAVLDLQGIHTPRGRPERAARDAARPARVHRRPGADPD